MEKKAEKVYREDASLGLNNKSITKSKYNILNFIIFIIN